MKAFPQRLSIHAAAMFALALTVLGQGETEVERVDLDQLLARVSDRVQQYYTNLLSISWNDRVRQEILKEDGKQKEKPRELVYDMIIRHQVATSPDDIAPFFIREVTNLVSIDGNPAKKSETAKPDDPRFSSMGSIGFLMTRIREPYRFTYSGSSELEGRKVLIIDVTNPQRNPPRVVWKNSFPLPGVMYSFQVLNVQYNAGRVWVDAETFDVLQVEWKSNPFDFERGKRKFRYEVGMTARFKRVSFDNPDQIFLVPDSLETFSNMKGGNCFPAVRVKHSFADFKRFLGDTKIVVVEETK